MLVVWRDAARFDSGVSTLSAWLFGITHHKVLKMLDRFRTGTREVPLEAGGGKGMAESEDASAQDPERAAIGRQLGAALANALEKLPPDQRAVLELTFGEGKSYQEIAEIMACPVNTIKTRMFHARKRLAGFLDEEQDEKSRSRLR